MSHKQDVNEYVKYVCTHTYMYEYSTFAIHTQNAHVNLRVSIQTVVYTFVFAGISSGIFSATSGLKWWLDLSVLLRPCRRKIVRHHKTQFILLHT